MMVTVMVRVFVRVMIRIWSVLIHQGDGDGESGSDSYGALTSEGNDDEH